MSEIRRNVLIVGDSGTGKTCLSIVFAKGTFPEVYSYGIFEIYVADVEVDGKHVKLTLTDIYGGEEYDPRRAIAYPNSHVILICFAIDEPDSLDNVQEKWISDIKRFCPNVPIILVGCKTDPCAIEELRKTDQRPVTPDEGTAVAQKIGAKYYLECSAKTGQGVREVFQYAARMSVLPISTPIKSRWTRVVKRATAILNVARPSTSERASTGSAREDDTNSSNPSRAALRLSAPGSAPQSHVVPIPQPSPLGDSTRNWSEARSNSNQHSRRGSVSSSTSDCSCMTRYPASPPEHDTEFSPRQLLQHSPFSDSIRNSSTTWDISSQHSRRSRRGSSSINPSVRSWVLSNQQNPPPPPPPGHGVEYPAYEASSLVSDNYNNFLEPLAAFNYVVKRFADIHPYAKVAFSVFSWASQAIIAQANQDRSIQDLQSRITDVYDFMLEHGRLESLISMQDIPSQASQVVYECAKFIQVYSQPNFLSQLGKGVLWDTDEAIAKYANAIENVMQLLYQYDALSDTHDILTTTHNIRQNIQLALEDIRRLGDNQFLNRISYTEGAGLNTIKVCLDGTREEILHEVINWIDDADPNAPRIFWLFGTACTGKSAIAHTIAHAMNESGALGSCFCFQRGDVKRHKKLFSTISRDLAIGDVWLKQNLARVVARDPSVATTTDLMHQWEKLIKEPLSAISRDIIGRVVIVIDALDESGDPRTRKDILSLLTKQAFALPVNVRILITSRPLPDICKAFSGALHIKRMSMDDVPMSSTEHDIRIYISNQLKGADYSFSADEIVMLAEKSDGLFGWAHLACNHIMSDTVTGLSEHERYNILISQTESRGTNLDDMYYVILKEIMGDRPQELTLSRFRSAMRHVLFTLEPLTLEALITMHHTVQPEQDKYDAESILRSMGSLLTGIHDRLTSIRPLHYSFREFLIDRDRSGQFFVNGGDDDDGSSATRCLLESMTKLLIGHADRLIKQPDFHGIHHFVPEIGNLMNSDPQAIEDWEERLYPLLNVLDKLLVPSNIESLKDGYCQECRFFQITRDTLTHFQTLRKKEDPDIEQYVKSLEEIIRYGDAGSFDMDFGRVFSSAAIVGLMMAILAHQR